MISGKKLKNYSRCKRSPPPPPNSKKTLISLSYPTKTSAFLQNQSVSPSPPNSKNTDQSLKPNKTSAFFTNQSVSPSPPISNNTDQSLRPNKTSAFLHKPISLIRPNKTQTREMALRPLDNTLPLASPDGPKKRAKIAVATAAMTPRVSGINDENLVVSAVTDAVEYVASEDLKALPDPEMKIKILMERLDSKDWLEVCEALNDARRFALHHALILLPMLDKMMMVLVRSMKNPRSALCKTSIMASADIFTSYGHLLLSPSSSPTTTQQEAFDHLLLQLLLKAFQDKRFVCEEAEKALRTMAASMPPLPLLQKLETYVAHKNPKVRAKAAVSISDCTSKLGIEGMKEFGLRKLLQISADMLNDRLPEAREAARRIAGSMYMAYTGGEEEVSPAESWQSLCTSSLAPISAQLMIRIIS